MKRFVKLARVTALAFAAGMSLLPATALALPDFERVVRYYSDDTYSNLAGQYVINCFGGSSMDGVATPYFTVEQTRCDPDGHPGDPDHPKL